MVLERRNFKFHCVIRIRKLTKFKSLQKFLTQDNFYRHSSTILACQLATTIRSLRKPASLYRTQQSSQRRKKRRSFQMDTVMSEMATFIWMLSFPDTTTRVCRSVSSLWSSHSSWTTSARSTDPSALSTASDSRSPPSSTTASRAIWSRLWRP